jgi:hypothetical protein
MSRALSIIIGLQIILGAIWTLPLLTADLSGLGPLLLFIYTYPFHAVFCLIALWAFWKHKTLRRKAALVLLLPIGILFLPYLITTIAGGPLEAQRVLQLIVVLVAICIVLCFIRPRRAASMFPAVLFRSRTFNLLAVVGMAFAWLLPVFLFLLVRAKGSESVAQTAQVDSSGMAVGYLFFVVGLYLASTGGAALFTMLLAWLGLHGGVEGAQRGLHKTQAWLAAPALIAGSLAAAWLAILN